MPELSRAASAVNPSPLDDAQTIGLIESWLKVEPDMRFGKAAANGVMLGLLITRPQFAEARRRVGITSPTAPQPTRRSAPAEQRRSAIAPAVPKNGPAPESGIDGRRRRRRGRPSAPALRDLSTLARELEAIVAERDRARAAVNEIARVLKALRR